MSERGAVIVAAVTALTLSVLFAIFVSTFGAGIVGGAVGLGLYLALKPKQAKPGPAQGGWPPQGAPQQGGWPPQQGPPQQGPPQQGGWPQQGPPPPGPPPPPGGARGPEQP